MTLCKITDDIHMVIKPFQAHVAMRFCKFPPRLPKSVGSANHVKKLPKILAHSFFEVSSSFWVLDLSLNPYLLEHGSSDLAVKHSLTIKNSSRLETLFRACRVI